MNSKTAQKLLQKVKNDYQKIALEFSDTRSYLWEELKQFNQYVKDGDTVLDLGCGNGRLYELFKNRPIHYTGIDNCKTLIQKAQERHINQQPTINNQQPIDKKKFGSLNRIQPVFLVGDALNLPAQAGLLFEENQFDVVFCIAVLHHIPSNELRLKALENIKKVLKKDSFLIMTNWNLYQKKYWRYFLNYKLKVKNYKMFSLKDVFIPWKSKSGEKIWRYYHAFAMGELKKLVKKAGFKIVDIYHTKKGQKTNKLKGTNLVLIAKT